MQCRSHGVSTRFIGIPHPKVGSGHVPTTCLPSRRAASRAQVSSTSDFLCILNTQGQEELCWTLKHSSCPYCWELPAWGAGGDRAASSRADPQWGYAVGSEAGTTPSKLTGNRDQHPRPGQAWVLSLRQERGAPHPPPTLASPTQLPAPGCSPNPSATLPSPPPRVTHFPRQMAASPCPSITAPGPIH